MGRAASRGRRNFWQFLAHGFDGRNMCFVLLFYSRWGKIVIKVEESGGKWFEVVSKSQSRGRNSTKPFVP